MEIKDNNVIIPKEEYDRSTELSYLTFVLGYDLLDDVLKKDTDVECDIAYDFCNGIATKFMGTEEYHNLRYSTYEMLDRWVNDNISEIITDYEDFSRIRKDEVEIYGDKEILEKGDRNGRPVAFVKWDKGGREEYLVAFEHKVTDDKLHWGYAYYYDKDIDKAKEDFKKVINGGNLADTFKKKTDKGDR